MGGGITDELDFHGTKHHDAYRKVDKFISDHICNGTREVYIFTGHSPKMKEIVKEVIEDYSATAKEDFLNKGMLVVNLR